MCGFGRMSLERSLRVSECLLNEGIHSTFNKHSPPRSPLCPALGHHLRGSQHASSPASWTRYLLRPSLNPPPSGGGRCLHLGLELCDSSHPHPPHSIILTTGFRVCAPGHGVSQTESLPRGGCPRRRARHGQRPRHERANVPRSDEFFDTQLYSATSWTRKLEGEPLPHCLRTEAPTPRPARPGAPRPRPRPLCNHPPTLAAHPASHTNAQANLGMFSDQQLSRKTRSRLLAICLQLPGKSAENPL
ncbi:uncharacterized protein LOC125133873 [Phacochoerus africanus]|uniref:uncharacterized protein LOC125133873 n=1 Tax=Phacochoerus africanus TaxID=41426 RepID=UPI001FD8F36C|nr:uncharacterized protein LOC125133873 [Phacochoerus africanus]